MKLARGTILPLVAVALIMTAVSAASFNFLRIPCTATIKYPPEIGVYKDNSLTDPLTEINWGNLLPGDVVTLSAFIQNEGETPVLLGISTDAWDPREAEQYIALTWNYNGEQIAVGNGISVKFQLTIFSDCTGITRFSFDIVITAEG